PTEPVDEAPTEPVDEAPTEPVDEAPTEPVDEAPTEPVDEAPTEPAGEPAEPVSELPEDVMPTDPIDASNDEPVLGDETDVCVAEDSLPGENDEPSGLMDDELDSNSEPAAQPIGLVAATEASEDTGPEEAMMNPSINEPVTTEPNMITEDLPNVTDALPVQAGDIATIEPVDAAPSDIAESDDTQVISDTEILESDSDSNTSPEVTTEPEMSGDIVDAETDHDVIFGGSGDDWLMGEGGNDMIFGNTSPLEDALLREMIAGRFSL
ncbi:MAG: hypothetical protein ACR2NZ_16120, partial [Rubripirellula sp.]